MVKQWLAFAEIGDLGRIFENEHGDVERRRVADDRARKPLAKHHRQPADVIEVAVGQDHRVDALGGKRKRCQVLGLGVLVALEDAAVDDDRGIADLQVIATPGYALSGAGKREHG